MAPAGAGTPVKKFAAQAGLLGSAIITLKRARRSPVQIANTMAKIHPRLPSSCRLQKYNISAGATPKLTKSARLSSSAPKRDVPLSMRARRPSTPSSIAAKTIAATAHSSLFSTAKRIAVKPAHNASRVIRLGSSVRTGMKRKRGRLPSRRSRSNGENGNDRLPGNRGLSFGDQRPRACGQVDVHARTEADHADALAGGDRRTFAHETDNPARHQSRDLHHADAPPVARDEQRVALVALARFVEVGADEGACVIDDALDLAGERAAVHVTIEHAHEDRHARQRVLAQFELLRRHRVDA